MTCDSQRLTLRPIRSEEVATVKRTLGGLILSAKAVDNSHRYGANTVVKFCCETRHSGNDNSAACLFVHSSSTIIGCLLPNCG